MYAKHGNLADGGASGAEANIKNLESRLEVIQSHFCILGSLKCRRWTAYYRIIILHRFEIIAGFCAHDPTHR